VNRSFFLCLAVCRITFQRLCHSCPVLSPARALMVRIPLGPRPSLPQLRSGSLCLVRRLQRYYGGVRLPTPVHHRLRLFTFPMRAKASLPRPVVGPPKFRHDPFTRDVLFDPGGMNKASHNGPAHVAFDHYDNLRSRDKPISWLNHTPHVAAVYAWWPALPSAHATLASRRPAGPYLGRTCTDRSRQLTLAPSMIQVS
jgi:hypothetical protein